MIERGPQPVDGPHASPTLDESGTVVGGRYRLLRMLGEGAVGIVYAATDERVGAEVAVKVVRGSARRDEVTVARFQREARAAGRLGHPNIVRVTDVGTSNGSPYVVMERRAGETLEARVMRAGRLDPRSAIEIHLQLADALAAAHGAGVLHRDVKPANIFLTELATGQVLVKLLDFGLAEFYEEPSSPRLTERGLLVGSLAYLAPERIAGGPADERGDVYAIGASLYESLAGELPFSAPNSMMMRARILAGGALPIEVLRPELDARLAEVVRSCLERDPEARLASAAEVRRRLLAAAEPADSPAPASAETDGARAEGSVSDAPRASPSEGDAPVALPAVTIAPVSTRWRALPGRYGVAMVTLGVVLAIACAVLLASSRAATERAAREPIHAAPSSTRPSGPPAVTRSAASEPRSTSLANAALAAPPPPAASPLAAAPPAASPRAASPRAASPRADSPRADSPRADSPRAESPPAESPRAASPRAASPPDAEATAAHGASTRSVPTTRAERVTPVAAEPSRAEPAPTEAAVDSESTEAPSGSPSRFDRVLEPDWSEPVDR